MLQNFFGIFVKIDLKIIIKFNQVFKFVLGLVDGILHTSKDSQIWSTSNPIGSESVRLFDVVKKLSMSLYDFQKLNLIAGLEYEDEILRNYMQSSEAQMPSFVLIEMKFSNIVFQQQLLFHENQMPLNFRFPDNKFRSKIESFSKNVTTTKKFYNLKPFENLFQTTTKSRSVIYRPIQSQNLINMVGFIDFEDVSLKRELMKQNLKKYYEPYALINVYYSGMENLVPNHNASFRPKDNNLNSIIISTELIGAHGNVQNFNISDTRCVYLKTMKEKFKWSRNECKLKFSDTKEATCECSCVGTFSITNDLYDPMVMNFLKWAPLIVEIIPLSIISYIGCALVFTISICTLVGLKYFRVQNYNHYSTCLVDILNYGKWSFQLYKIKQFKNNPIVKNPVRQKRAPFWRAAFPLKS
ncbi:adhesion G -coupled receptor L2-like [Brachionus plicatilis]|uniref:Adhesion G-coupled receptor L2-like n=1 Tax=Brachionus plicatilis TaxID=10195 RepID=A0A3M7S3R1_BRAPC|nr:adhesion G -coupled receptor L2-like [Brachionus plicatilis]